MAGSIKVVLFGATGQVGTELCSGLLLEPGIELYTPTRDAVDLRYIHHITEYLRQVTPAIIINAAAYTAVDKAESDIDSATDINTSAIASIASWAAKHNAYLIHYSTDYVFNGTALLPYTEEDFPNPLNVYGKTKYDGDLCVLSSACKGLIFRTSWVYGKGEHNFPYKIVDRLKRNIETHVVSDQIGCPTSSYVIATTTINAIKIDYPGDTIRIINLACAGHASWYTFATEIKRILKLGGCLIPVTTGEYGKQKAIRPKYTVLNTTKLYRSGIFMPDWKVTLEQDLPKFQRVPGND